MYGEDSVWGPEDGDGLGGSSLCAGCLVSGRRLQVISDECRKRYFVQILSEIPATYPEAQAVRVCWECSARLSAAVGFRRQVKSCYLALRKYYQLNAAPLSGLARAPRLQSVLLSAAHASLVETDAAGGCPDDVAAVKTEYRWADWRDVKEEKYDAPKDELGHGGSPDRDSFTLSDNEELKYLIGKLDDSDTEKEKRAPGSSAKGARVSKRKRSEKKEKLKVLRLSLDELMEERRAVEQSEEYASAEYKCDRCLVCFDDGEMMATHLKMKHDPALREFRCATCDCAFRSQAALLAHAARHRRRYQCVRCAARHASKRRAALHRARCGADTTSEVQAFEPSKLASIGAVDVTREPSNHSDAGDILCSTDDIKNEEGSGPKSKATYPCELCSKSFRWKTSLRKHSELHRIQSGQKERPYCDTCRLPFTTTSNYQKHVKTSSKHQILLKVTKQACEPDGGRAAPLEEIRASVHSQLEKFACPHCDKRFQWKGNLLRHIQSHKARANGELHCAPCDRKFSSLATYQQHMKISKKHVSEDDFRYMCSDCGKKFANKTRLKDHTDWEHLKVYSHTCPLCQKVFKSNTSLYLHKQVVHRKDNGDHLCDHCGKAFPNRAKLRSHITAMHTGEQPYKCKLCVATFSWHSCLSRHVKVVHHKIKTKRKRKLKDGVAPPAPPAPLPANV